jgi:hypothetical protein
MEYLSKHGEIGPVHGSVLAITMEKDYQRCWSRAVEMIR